MNLNDFKTCYKRANAEEKEKLRSEFIIGFPATVKEAERRISDFYIDDFCDFLLDFPELIAMDRFKLFKQDYIRCGYVVPMAMYGLLESETEETPSIH